MGDATNSACSSFHKLAEKLAGIVLHVPQRSIRGLKAMETKPLHRCPTSGRKRANRPDFGRK